MSNSVRKERKKLVIDIVIIVVVALVVAVLVWILTSGKETTIMTDTGATDETDSVSCKIGEDLESGFFDFKKPNTINQEVKAIFTNKKLSKIYYSYTGEYESGSKAESASAFLTAQFNEYLGGHGISLSTVSHSIYSIDSSVRIDLYTEVKNLNLYTGKLFLLDSNEFNTAKALAPPTFEKLYKNKGFVCENAK